MRFALMIEPQQGLTYDEQLAIVRRAEAAGFESFFRSDHYQSFPGPDRTADDRCLGRPRRAGARHVADRAGRARLAGDVPPRRQPREGRDDRRRDVRRPDRVRARRRLERRRAPPARPAVPADRRAGRPARGQPGDPPWPLGRAGRLVVRRQAGADRRRAVLPEAGRRARPPETAERRCPAEAPRRWRWVAAIDADRRPLRGRVQPVVVVAGPGAREVRSADVSLPGDRTRPGYDHALDDGGRADGPGRGRAGSAEARRCWRHSARTRAARTGSTPASRAGSSARRTQARAMVARFAEAGAERIMLQDFIPRDLDMIDLMAEALF